MSKCHCKCQLTDPVIWEKKDHLLRCAFMWSHRSVAMLIFIYIFFNPSLAVYCAEVKRNEMKWVERRAELAVTYHSTGHFHLLLWSGSTKALCFSYPLACSQNFILTYMDTEGSSQLTGTDLCNLGNKFGIVSCCLCVTRGRCLQLMLCCSKHSQPWLVWLHVIHNYLTVWLTRDCKLYF